MCPAKIAFGADEPITSRDHDLLGRAELVDVIAEHLLAGAGGPALVLSIHAPWGAGKSSFLNLLRERLSPCDLQHGDHLPTLVRFNPWHYRNVDQLVHLFFQELARGIGQDERIENRKNIGQLLTASAGLLTAVPALSGPLLPIQPILTSVLRGSGEKLKKTKSIYELKDDLDKDLKALTRRVIVFVDDIDRLERDAIRLLFRVIRLNANFPNVTYVLAFDRSVVEEALDGEQPGRGRHYLEKIVQTSFDIPDPEREIIQFIVDDRLSEAVASVPGGRLDDGRYRSLMKNGFAAHFRTVRAIVRYTNGLRLTLPPVAEEVDQVDFLGVELIRLFHPELHEEMAKRKDLLTSDGWLSGLLMLDNPNEARVARQCEWLDRWCEKAGAQGKAVRKVLGELFPGLGGVPIMMEFEGSQEVEWRRRGRICSEAVFDKFFLLGVPIRRIPEAKLRVFLEELTEGEAGSGSLRIAEEAMSSGRLTDLFERAEDRVDTMTEEAAKALAELAFQRPEFDSPHFFLLTRLGMACARRQSTEDRRGRLLTRIVSEAKSLLSAIILVDRLERGEQRKTGDDWLDDAKQEEVREAATIRLEREAEEGTLWASERWYYMLHAWARWCDDEAVRTAVRAYTAGDRELLRFLEQERNAQAQDVVVGTLTEFDKQRLGRWLDVDDASDRLADLERDGGENAKLAGELKRLIGGT